MARFTREGVTQDLFRDFVAGCDGYRGISRRYIPDAEARTFLREYPFAWFGVLADAVPSRQKRGFAHSTRGLAVASARSATVGRL